MCLAPFMEAPPINMSRDAISVSYIPSVSSQSPLVDHPANESAVSSFNPDPVSKEMVDLVTGILSCHVNPIIGACGIVGNLLNIVVFLLQKRSQPMNSVLVVLALVDAVYLVFVNLEYVACSIRRYDVIAARNFTILSFPHLIWVAVTLSRVSSVLTVVISVERCIVVTIPLKAKVFVTSRTIYVSTILACVITTLAHIPLFLRGEIEWRYNPGLKQKLPYLELTPFAINNAAFLNLYKNLVLNVLFRYVTMIVISACTGATIARLKRYSRWRLKSVTSHSERTTISERDARVSMTMMRVCVLFMICSIPGCIMLTIRLIEPQFDFYGVYRNSFDLSRELGNLFTVINSSFNFIIYMRGGDEFLNTFCSICRKLLPRSCFGFLFRCVMRTADADGADKMAVGQESSTRSYHESGGKNAGKRGDQRK